MKKVPSLDTPMTIEDQMDNAGCSRVKDKPMKIMSPIKAKLRYNIKLLQQKLRRRDRKITDLKSLLDVAIKKDMSSDSASKMQETFGRMSLEILTNTLNNQERK
ncbi:hypothetical protein JTE90_024707 [Oedothorax gibbosus]|uniref:Uncharacterized protein n=1 Tax=Oedothorax gibbosus TaxID=931172 RepID=A0AAV6UB80_9ARAC|nr:hypothetical protein JTE90_024707 [Oedothorax gibbosus]